MVVGFDSLQIKMSKRCLGEAFEQEFFVQCTLYKYPQVNKNDGDFAFLQQQRKTKLLMPVFKPF